MTTRLFWTLLAVASLGLSSSVPAADWPMLGRDGTRNAVSPEKGPPLSWQMEEKDNGVLIRPGWNVLWESQLGSLSFAPPSVADGLVWIGTNNERPRDPRIKGDGAVLMCFRASDGRFLWQYVSPRLKDDHRDYPHSGVNCSPLIEGDRLCFTTNRAEVVCLDIGPLKRGQGEPKLLWKLDMIKELGVSPVGMAMSIGFSCSLGASYKDRLFVITGNGMDQDFAKVAAPDAPSLLCVDRHTGKVLWQDKSPGKNILYVQWSSPLVIEIKGRGQVVAAQGDGWVRSFDALTGKPIWQFDTNPKNAVWNPRNARLTTRNSLIATPVYSGGYIYLGNGNSPADFGPGPGRLYCIDPTREGDISPELPDGPGKGKPNPNSGAVWCFEGNKDKPAESMRHTISSVAVHDGLVIAPVLDGYIHCLDAKTGKRYWTHDARSGISGSPLIVDRKVYLGTEDGDMLVLALAREKKLLAVTAVGPSVHAGPVFANGVLYVAADSQLYALKSDGKTDRPPGHWPQWRGVERTNVSAETGLLKRWPKDGPPLAWKVEGLGQGAASVAVAGGRVFTLGYRNEHERLTALDEKGKLLWSVTVGPAAGENAVMRWLAQRTPTIDGERAFAMTARGDVVCVRTADGKELWRKNYLKDLAGSKGAWGFGDRPLVDGDALICVPGGKTATVAALNKKTGDVLWKCAVPGGDVADHGATVVSTVGDVRHYVVVLRGGLAGVAAKDGKLLWRYDRIGNGTANCYSPIVSGDLIFCASGYGKGYALLRLTRTGDGLQMKEQYYHRKGLPNWQETTVQVGNHVFAGTDRAMTCLEMETGKMRWEDRGEVGGQVSVTCADGHLYLRGQDGKVAIIEASAEKYVLKGTLKIPGAQPKGGSTAPVVAGGRLYLRDDDQMFVYDVKEGAAPDKPGSETVPPPDQPPPPRKEREPDAVFVPTPQDVVEKMLELANVKKEHVVYDLGCGDGRIVVTAAKKYGCRAVGYDIDHECVKMSRENVRKADIGKLVTIERKDLFAVDLVGADIIALYLLPKMNERLIPQLEKLKPGSRIVCHANAIPGVRPDKVVSTVSKDDGLPHRVYLYTTPLRREAK